MGGNSEVARLVARCAADGGHSCDELVTTIGELDFANPHRDEALDGLASAAASSPAATDTLVRIIYKERFVRAEIRKVLIGDDQLAEEALQETALAMVRGLPGFRGDSTFRTWVSAIGRNQAIGILRRVRPTAELVADSGEVARYSSVLASRVDVEAAMAQLPDHFREAVQLRDIEQRSYAEIATILGIELNTVRSRLARGRARLSTMFESDDQPPITDGPRPM